MKLRTPSPPSLCFAAFLLWTISNGNIVLAAQDLKSAQDKQAMQAPVNFEVVSVKPSAPDCTLIMIGASDDGFHLHCLSLLLFLQYAYNLNPFEDGHVLGLPAWASTAHYDLDAPVEGADRARFESLSPPEKAQLLRPALDERFALRIHQDQREMPVYALVQGKSLPKLRPTDPNDPGVADKPTLLRKGKDHLEAWHCSMQDLLSFISPLRGRPVVNRTGLSGSYDFSLNFTPDSTSMSSNQPAPEADAPPSIFTAVQEQLGLRLIPDKAPQPVVVVDAASPPTAN